MTSFGGIESGDAESVWLVSWGEGNAGTTTEETNLSRRNRTVKNVNEDRQEGIEMIRRGTD